MLVNRNLVLFAQGPDVTISGPELTLQQDFSKIFSLKATTYFYYNIIDTFAVENKYPVVSLYAAPKVYPVTLK